MGNLMQDANAARNQVFPLPFQTTDMGDAAGVYKAIQVGSNDYCIPWAGSVVGISARHNADLTGGVVTHRVTIAGTAIAATLLSCVTDDTHQNAFKTIDAFIINFPAGSLIGADWTKSGTVAPTTTDVVVVIWILCRDISL
jgi:ABC-type enterobactin transport system permease subunit